MATNSSAVSDAAFERLGLSSVGGPSLHLKLRGRSREGIAGEELAAAMMVARRVEEKIRELRLAGDIVGSIHLGIGQEGIPVGALSSLEEGDPVFATYRGHMWALASGTPVEAVFAELLGRAGGVNEGRGGSALFSDIASSFYGENSIVGAGAPIAAGAALASKHRGDGRVALTVFGDGAMNQGSVNEALNFAAAFALPLVFVCENNRYSEMTLIADVVKEERLTVRAQAFGIPAINVDGNDAVAVQTAVDTAAAHARSGQGPFFVEAKTERLVGHYIGDPEQYRKPNEVEELRSDEPLERFRRSVGDAEFTAMQDYVNQLVDERADSALAQPLSDASEVRAHLYAKERN